MKTVDVIVAGELYVDLILSGFDHWPNPGQEAFAESFEREAGGGAAITAAGLARLRRNVEIFGVVGDSDGDWLLSRLRESGAGTSAILRHPSEPTGFTVVVSGAEDRAFFTYMGANQALPDRLRDAAEQGAFSSARHVHLAIAPDLTHAGPLVDAIHRYDSTVSLDVGWHPGWFDDPRALQLLAAIDIIFPNEMEALRISKSSDAQAALEVFRLAGVRRVALKLGAAGAALLWDGDLLDAKPPEVRPIDFTGAGDCFDAGFLAAWLGGRSPADCLAAGNLCGALSTQARGGISAFPERHRVEKFL